MTSGGDAPVAQSATRRRVVDTYDMQARSYRPDIGRFLSQDRYEGASADAALQSDPLTNNRYAFGSGNPIDNVESDGHDPHAIESGCEGDPNCGDRVALASAAQSGPAAVRRARRAQRASKPLQTVLRSKAATKREGETVYVKTEIDRVNYFATPDTCTKSVECFKNDAIRTTKWSQTPSGKPTATRAQLQGANNARTHDPGRLTRQMAANEVGLRGSARDLFLGWERNAPSIRTSRIAATFDPPPQPDNAIGVDDAVDGVRDGIAASGTYVGDVVGAAGGVAGSLGKPFSRTATRSLPFVGPMIGTVGDELGGTPSGEAIARNAIGGGFTVITGVGAGTACTALSGGVGLVTGICVGVGAGAGAAVNRWVVQPQLDPLFD